MGGHVREGVGDFDELRGYGGGRREDKASQGRQAGARLRNPEAGGKPFVLQPFCPVMSHGYTFFLSFAWCVKLEVPGKPFVLQPFCSVL